ncbi:MAG: hypothetical protein R3C05_12170 [Pirellulaceae bacterium]
MQALLNTTRRSLLPDGDVTSAKREQWEREVKQLGNEGIHRSLMDNEWLSYGKTYPVP